MSRVLIILTVIFGALGIASPGLAQVIPPSDQPGQERFRFTEPPAPLSRPAGPLIQLPTVRQLALVCVWALLGIMLTGAAIWLGLALYGDPP